MSHLDLSELQRFSKEKFIFTFKKITLFILLYASL